MLKPESEPVNEVEEEIEIAIASLKKEFEAKLPARFVELREQVDDFKHSGNDESLEAAIQSAHKLVGTAGSYGFELVSQHSHLVEVHLKLIRLCRQKTEVDSSASPPYALLEELLSELNSVLPTVDTKP
jgi:HPt (histidine-containing phosphotransfer) domain-containing protein